MSRLCTRSFTIASILTFSAFLTGCYSSQQLIQPSLSHKVSRNPAFLDHITIPGADHGIALNADNYCADNTLIDISRPNTLQSRFASIMNVLPQAITNLSLYHFIDEWYGVRYRLGGNDKKGIDCSALVQRIYGQVFGQNLLRTAFEQFTTSNIIWNTHNLKEGDLVFFRINGSRISHVGVYLMNNFFVHASTTKGVMISSLTDHYWQHYFACAGRMM